METAIATVYRFDGPTQDTVFACYLLKDEDGFTRTSDEFPVGISDLDERIFQQPKWSEFLLTGQVTIPG